MLANHAVGAYFHGLDLNVHMPTHLLRAAQEGVAFAFRYGLDVMRAGGLHPTVVLAGHINMFLNELFTRSFVNATGLAVELYETDGSVGAALGTGIGVGYYATPAEAFRVAPPLRIIHPDADAPTCEAAYQRWRQVLLALLPAPELAINTLA